MIPLLYGEDYFYDNPEAEHFITFLGEATTCQVSEKRNDTFTMEMTYPLSGQAAQEIIPGRVIEAPPDGYTTRQPFRIVRTKRTISTGQLEVYAEHISYDLLGCPLKPKVDFTATGARDAMIKMDNATLGANDFTFRSSINGTRTFRWRIGEVNNAREALAGVRGSILDHYHGEYLFDGSRISLLANRGKDRAVAFIYGVNLLDTEIEVDYSNYATSIYPFSGSEDGEGVVTLPEYYIDSPHYTGGMRQIIKVVDFSSDEIRSVEALRNRANRYIRDNNVGQPAIRATVSGADLKRVLNFSSADSFRLQLCDTVRVIIPHQDIDLQAKITGLTYDALKEEVISVDLGEPAPTLRQTLQSSVDALSDRVGTLSGTAAGLVDNTISAKVKDEGTGKNYRLIPVIRNGVLTWEKEEIK
ncbi:phage tail spike protein [Peptococcus simiae]|uniref:phage tail spike protein n=1 Tax=Peptococcus simiae TaxID=1643805 RepID=UPI0039810E09